MSDIIAFDQIDVIGHRVAFPILSSYDRLGMGDMRNNNGSSRSLTSSAAIVRDHLKASKGLAKRILKSRKSAVAFLVEAGIVDRSGKRLAKPYR